MGRAAAREGAEKLSYAVCLAVTPSVLPSLVRIGRPQRERLQRDAVW